MTPLVSVCMPAFNAGQYLDAAITSIRKQTFKDFELLILDDGSTDDTLKIARRHADQDSRIQVFENERNRGLVYTRNRLLAAASGKLIAAADADDVFVDTRLERQVQFLDSHSDVGIVGSNVCFCDATGNEVRQPSNLHTHDEHIRFFLMLGPCVWNTVTMYRTRLLKAVGGYDEGLDNGAEDYDMWCRLSKFTKFANLPEVLATVHVHVGSVTSNDERTKSNIYDVATPVLSEYLDRQIPRNDVKDLLLLFWHGLGTKPDVSNVLSLAKELRRVAARKETSATYRVFASRLHQAVLILGQAEIYTNRQQSFEAIKLGIRLNPMSITHPSLIKYLMRFAIPPGVRNMLKSGFRSSNT